MIPGSNAPEGMVRVDFVIGRMMSTTSMSWYRPSRLSRTAFCPVRAIIGISPSHACAIAVVRLVAPAPSVDIATASLPVRWP